ncbi:MAG: hypothetical protein HQL80_11525 [Magnetococcales bacterium]|nr:hypothetical protein [Magnetococcales bacterium]
MRQLPVCYACKFFKVEHIPGREIGDERYVWIWEEYFEEQEKKAGTVTSWVKIPGKCFEGKSTVDQTSGQYGCSAFLLSEEGAECLIRGIHDYFRVSSAWNQLRNERQENKQLKEKIETIKKISISRLAALKKLRGKKLAVSTKSDGSINEG